MLRFFCHLLNLEVPPLELFGWWLAIPYALCGIGMLLKIAGKEGK